MQKLVANVSLFLCRSFHCLINGKGPNLKLKMTKGDACLFCFLRVEDGVNVGWPLLFFGFSFVPLLKRMNWDTEYMLREVLLDLSNKENDESILWRKEREQKKGGKLLRQEKRGGREEGEKRNAKQIASGE